jgi:hypothetical protein
MPSIKKTEVGNATTKRCVKEIIILAGGQKELAKRLGVCQQRVSQWRRCGFIPLHHAAELSALYGVPVCNLVNPTITELFNTPVPE